MDRVNQQLLNEARVEVQRNLENNLCEVRHELNKYQQWGRADEISSSGYLEKEAALVEAITEIENRIGGSPRVEEQTQPLFPEESRNVL